MNTPHIRSRIFIFIAAFFAVALGVLLGVFSTIAAPTNPAGIGSGAIATDASHNIAVGTSTTQSNTRFLIVGSTTDSSAYGLQVQNSNNTSLLSVRNDGLVSIPNLNASGTFGGTIIGTMTAGNVSAGQFGSNTGGGNYSFPASVGIGTTNPSQKLGVNGNISASGFCNGSDCRTDVNRTVLCDTTNANPCYVNTDFRLYVLELIGSGNNICYSNNTGSNWLNNYINFQSMCGYDWRINGNAGTLQDSSDGTTWYTTGNGWDWVLFEY